MSQTATSPRFQRIINSILGIPLYVFIFAAYPSILMYAHNVTELQIWMIIRPTFISLIVAMVVLGCAKVLFRSWNKAALFTLVFLVIFFSYGQIYQLHDTAEGFLLNLLRHRYLILISIILLLVSGWLIQKGNPSNINLPLNVITIAILIIPTSRIISYENRREKTEAEMLTITSSDIPALDIVVGPEAPDIYYIILDTYTREDVLSTRFEYDNSQFINALKDEGFFIGECSRSNYAQTLLSLNSSLNMSFVQNIHPKLDSVLGLTNSLNNNILYHTLRASGYKLTTFDTGFPPGTITNSDNYLSPKTEEPLKKLFEGLQAFESMFYDSTAFKLILDDQTSQPAWLQKFINSSYSEFRENVFFQLDNMSNLPPTASPKLVHIHLIAPHPPATFDADGNPVNATRYYTLNPDLTSRREFARKAYIDEVTYLNKRMLEIIKQIKLNSTRPVVIIVQGDHGTYGFGAGDKYDRIKILNAYYFSDGDYSMLYNGITPVNTFRVVLNKYFGSSLSLMPDRTYYSPYEARFDFEEITENNPACTP